MRKRTSTFSGNTVNPGTSKVCKYQSVGFDLTKLGSLPLVYLISISQRHNQRSADVLSLAFPPRPCKDDLFRAVSVDRVAPWLHSHWSNRRPSSSSPDHHRRSSFRTHGFLCNV